MVPSSTVVTWCLNPSHVWNPAALSWCSQIPSAWGLFLNLSSSRNPGMSAASLWRVYLSSHTWGFVQHTHAGRHATWYVSCSHCLHTWYTIYKKVTYSKPSEMAVFTPHTQTAWLTWSLGLTSDMSYPPRDSQRYLRRYNVNGHCVYLIKCYAHAAPYAEWHAGVMTPSTFHRQINGQTATSADYVKVSRLSLCARKRSGFPESWVLAHAQAHTLVL